MRVTFTRLLLFSSAPVCYFLPEINQRIILLLICVLSVEHRKISQSNLLMSGFIYVTGDETFFEKLTTGLVFQ